MIHGDRPGPQVALLSCGLIYFRQEKDMPDKPLHFCRYPGCGELVSGQYCVEHQAKAEADEQTRRQRYDKGRGTAQERGYDSRWRKARRAYLLHHPLCVECEKEGKLTPATVVDHITPHRGDKKLFWDKTNWQPLCKEHHDIKTAKEDGGFGNRRGGG